MMRTRWLKDRLEKQSCKHPFTQSSMALSHKSTNINFTSQMTAHHGHVELAIFFTKTKQLCDGVQPQPRRLSSSPSLWWHCTRFLLFCFVDGLYDGGVVALRAKQTTTSAVPSLTGNSCRVNVPRVETPPQQKAQRHRKHVQLASWVQTHRATPPSRSIQTRPQKTARPLVGTKSFQTSTHTEPNQPPSFSTHLSSVRKPVNTERSKIITQKVNNTVGNCKGSKRQ